MYSWHLWLLYHSCFAKSDLYYAEPETCLYKCLVFLNSKLIYSVITSNVKAEGKVFPSFSCTYFYSITSSLGDRSSQYWYEINGAHIVICLQIGSFRFSSKPQQRDLHRQCIWISTPWKHLEAAWNAFCNLLIHWSSRFASEQLSKEILVKKLVYNLPMLQSLAIRLELFMNFACRSFIHK